VVTDPQPLGHGVRLSSDNALKPRQLVLLVLLTLTWGLNWPIMKLGVTGYPPLTFRVVSMWLGLPVLWALGAGARGRPPIERRDWRELAWLTATNMLVWHTVVILAVEALSSGRAAILGYTMPIWSALWGWARFRETMRPRQVVGIAAAAVGVVLLLWHEFGGLRAAGRRLCDAGGGCRLGARARSSCGGRRSVRRRWRSSSG
jgi:drug/metabolite transporter (DMT)-like permease